MLRVWCVATGWSFVLVSLLLTASGMPQRTTMFDRMLGVEQLTHWDGERLELAFPFMAMGLVMYVFALVAASQRMKRKHDGYGVALILLGLTSSIGVIGHLLRLS